MEVTIKDIAEKAGVSITTVSRVLNNKTKGVGEKTRKKVLEIVEELNYIPNAVAKGLVTKKTNILGLIIPDITNPYFPEIAKGVEDTANEYGYNIILCDSNNVTEKEKNYIRILREHYVSGIIYNSFYKVGEDTIKSLVNTRMPFVLVETNTTRYNSPCIYTDGEVGMSKLISYLIDMGHRKIAYISGPLESYSAEQRLAGYKSALINNGIEIDESLIEYGDTRRASGYDITDKLMSKELDFTALVCFNDLMAVGALQRLQDLGVRVPDDISLAGFDNIYVTKITNPKITTVAQPAYDMGCEAARVLIEKIEKRAEANKNKIVFEPILKIRDSVKKIDN